MGLRTASVYNWFPSGSKKEEKDKERKRKKGKEEKRYSGLILVAEGTCWHGVPLLQIQRVLEKNLLTFIGDARHAHRYPALCFGENNQ